jgi:hypothetical protein
MRGTAVAAVLLVVVPLALLPGFDATAGASTAAGSGSDAVSRAPTTPTTPTTSAGSNLQQAPRAPGAPPLPAACNLAWPTSAWPPVTDSQAEAHTLRPSDLPSGLRESPAQLASNGPDLDQLAMGWPQAGFAEISAYPAQRTSPEMSVDEIVGRAATVGQAAAAYLRARNVIFGSCVRHWPGREGQPRYPMAWAGSGLFAFEMSDQQDHGTSSAAVVIVGHRGRFDFELRVGTFAYTPLPTQKAAVPTRAKLAVVLDRALARLNG